MNELEIIKLVVNGGMGVAVIVTVVLFLRYLAARDKACDECRKETQTFLANHLSEIARALESLNQKLLKP